MLIRNNKFNKANGAFNNIYHISNPEAGVLWIGLILLIKIELQNQGFHSGLTQVTQHHL